MASPLRPILVNSLLTAVSLLVGLLMCEGALRVTGFLPGNPLERLINHPDSYLGYRMIPEMRETIPGPGGVYTAEIVSLGFPDDAGFRDDGISPPVDSVFIGDSFVWGYGVELADSISERYEHITGRDAVNLGMTSWTSPNQYARLLARYGVALRPRIAFVEALIDNDFGDLPNFAAWEASGTDKSYPEWMTDRSMGYEPDTLSYQLRRFLYDHSALGRFVSDRVQFGIKERNEPADNDILHVTDDGLDLILDRRALAIGGDGPDSGQVELFRVALKDMRSLAEGNGIQLVVFIVPTKEMVYQQRFPDPATQLATDWRYAAITRLLTEEGIAHVDMLPPFRAAAERGEQLYFANDTHWTPLGHERAAALLDAYRTTHCNEDGCVP